MLAAGANLSAADQNRDTEQQLKHALLGSSVMIRNFYTDPTLVYDPSGRLIKGGESDCWLRAQFRVQKIKLRDRKLMLEGDRLIGEYKPYKKELDTAPLNEKVKIEIELDQGHEDAASVGTLLTKIFLTKNDKLEDLIPTAFTKTGEDNRPGQARSSDPSDIHPDPDTVGNGVSPPRILYQPDPEYSETARQHRLQGTVTLWMVVGADGLVHRIRVVRCLGEDLDAKAVKAVSTWKFEPAQKNGLPTAVQLNVEVNFRLY